MNKKTENIPSIGFAEVSDYSPTPEEEKEMLAFEKQAEKDIDELKQTSSVTFRWSEFEIRRAKKIAVKMGLPYQTYLKMSLKQAMDRDELRFN